MILLTIALIIAGVAVLVLASIATVAIQESRRQAHYKQKAYREEARAKADIDTLGAENSRLREEIDELHRENQRYRESVATSIQVVHNENRKLLQENAALNARNTALVEAMEARPTQPKRVARKNVTQAHQQEEA